MWFILLQRNPPNMAVAIFSLFNANTETLQW